MTWNWQFSVALSEVNTKQWARWFICHHEFSLLSLIFVKGGKKSSQEKNDNTFFCSSERKAEAASLNAVFLALWKCFSSATGLRESLFFFQRHCNQIYGCSSALPQHDAVVYSSACSSWKQAEGEQLTRACRGYSLEGGFFPKAKQYMWNSSSCRRDGFSGASSWYSVRQRRCIRSGCQLLMEKKLQTGRLRVIKSTAQTPFGKIL